MGKLDLMDEISHCSKAHIRWGGPVASSSMEKIKPLNTHLLGGTLKKLMAVKKGLNF